MMILNRGKVILLLLSVLLASCGEEAGRSDSGSVISSGEIDVFQMRVGDCFDDESAVDDGTEVTELPGVPCFEPHDNEIYAIFNSTLPKFPGGDQMQEIATEECIALFEDFVDEPYETSILDIFPVTPTLSSWTEINDREIACALYHLEAEKLIGSMRNSGI
ncbi:septum formation family protein [Gammaproteobacteria bacterium]|nr:septum formation family protein [Gammaproteobacteria bacterium]